MIRAVWSLIPSEMHPKARVYAALVALTAILNAVATIALVPLIAALFGPRPADAWLWLGVLAGSTLLTWVVDGVSKRYSNDVAWATLHTAQHTLADHVAQVRQQWFNTENTALTRQAVGTAGFDLVTFLTHLVTPIIVAFVMPPALAIGLLFVSVPIGITALIAVPVLWLAFWASGRFMKKADAELADANAQLAESLQEFARAQPALRSSRRVDAERTRVGQALKQQEHSMRELIFLQIPGQLLFSLATQATLLALAVVIAWQFTSGAITAALGIGLLVAGVRFIEAITELSRWAAAAESATGAFERLDKVLAAPAHTVGSSEADVQGAPAIRLQNVGFAYDGEAPVLRDLNLAFEPGTTTAIVGPSGSGKSTILSLIAGLEHPTSGKVLVGGHDIAELSADARRGLSTFVFQHPYLFDGSIRDNISLGNETDVSAPAALARVTPALDLDDQVGERGGRLSGGERQRVSIARALAKPAPVLLVDEATSALDAENERAVADSLVNDPVARTRVIVAHRLSSIREADRVLFLEDGAVVEDGTVDELITLGGRFATFWKHQEAAAEWELA